MLKKNPIAPYTLTKPLVLVGLMGVGKSAVGRRVAKKLGIPFFDVDREIEKKVGLSISEIFEEQGEAAFRILEQNLMDELLNGQVCVLATGGGAFIQPAVRALVKEKGLSLWLYAQLSVLLERTGRNRNRPLLLQGNPEDILSNLMEKRNPFYEEADLRLSSQAVSVEKTVRALFRLLKGHLNAQEKISQR